MNSAQNAIQFGSPKQTRKQAAVNSAAALCCPLIQRVGLRPQLGPGFVAQREAVQYYTAHRAYHALYTVRPCSHGTDTTLRRGKRTTEACFPSYCLFNLATFNQMIAVCFYVQRQRRENTRYANPHGNRLYGAQKQSRVPSRAP